MPYHLVPKSLLARLGRRGAALLLLGVVWMLQGIIVLSMRAGVEVEHSPVPHENVPFPYLGLMWAVGGLVAAVVGFRRTLNDHTGWIFAAGPPLVITASYLVAGMTWVATAGNVSSPAYFLVSAGWSAIALLVGVLAGWPEPCESDECPKKVRRRHRWKGFDA